MANNYSQPYYGFPHGYPPPQMHPSAQPEEQGGPPHMHQAPPAADAFQHIARLPGLAPVLPGINLTSYAHNSQQPPFPAPAWPPTTQLPPDPNVWASFLQSGAFPPPSFPPPPFPVMGYPPPSLPHTPQNPAMPAPFPSQFPPQPAHSTAASSERIQEVMDSDREDGELSEGEPSSQGLLAKVNGRAHPEPPRSVPQAPHTSSYGQNGYSPSRPAAGQAAAKEIRREAPQRASPPTLMDKVQKDREDARQFIKLLHSNNIPYRTLASEKLDLELLRGLYQSVNLPSEPAPILPSKANGTSTAPAVQPVLAAQAQPPKPAPAVKTNLIPAPSANSAASPTAPGDRKDYIARLQAAKAAKQGGGAKPSPPQHIPPAKASTPQPATTPTVKAPVTDEQRARNTELIKQRLEAIKAKQKPLVTATNGAAVPPVLPEQTTKTVTPGISTPTTQGYMSPFPGIPGLFMNAPPAFANSAPIVSEPSPSIPQKRPAPAEFTEVSTSRASVTPYTRPLGQSPHADQEDDSMIIDVSEDETNGSDMDIEDDQPATKAVQHLRSDLATLPSPVGSAMPVASAVSTPGAQTPTTAAREKELVDKEKKLVAMRETLKKKLAEKRERDKAAAAAADASSPMIQKPLTPLLPPQSDAPSKLPTPMIESASPMPVQSNKATVGAGRPNVDSQGDTKRLRRAEIQFRLPTLDAEIAMNASRMVQLTKEMEQLKAQNEKIAKDKEQLTKELEDLGIDTEGMSHAELRAKKDEIDREQSMEPETQSQTAKPAPQSALDQQFSAVQLSIESMAATAIENERVVFSTPLPPSSQIPPSYATLPRSGFGQGQPQPQSQYLPVADNLGSTKILTTGSRLDETTRSTYEPQLTQEDAVQSDDPEVRPNAETSSTKATPAPETQESVITPDEDEDLYSPPPPAAMDLDISTGGVEADTEENQTSKQPVTENSPSEEGEIQMSVSEGDDEGEEEYEPEEPVIVADIPTQEAQNTETDIAPSVPTSQVSTEDQEAYEPPDVDQEMSDVLNEGVISEQYSEAGQAEAEDGAMDIASSSEESSDESDSDDESTPEPEMESSISANNLPQQDTNVADDLAPELQPETSPSAAVVEPMPAPVEEDLARFTPYESPLRMFKSYRYHPTYAQDIPGGFLSLTFSHQIDPEKPFCQYESAGGACNDPECHDQHFRDVAITGDKLLVQLGTANPGKTSEEKQRWNDGLRGVLKELRQKNIKDPNGIAVEIARYRRQFLNDDTRVVNL